jgi:hypothetical protein
MGRKEWGYILHESIDPYKCNGDEKYWRIYILNIHGKIKSARLLPATD